MKLARALLAAGLACASIAVAGEPELRQRYEEMHPAPDIVSAESAGAIQGEIHGVMPHPLAVIEDALGDAAHWCEILTLTYNIKRCDPLPGPVLSVLVGKTAQEPIDNASRMQLDLRSTAGGPRYMRKVLEAARGPFGTRNYVIAVEAIPIDAHSSFVHLSYSYELGRLSRVAAQVYLATEGASKVGFTMETDGQGGGAQLVGGLRGVMERNTVRYFFAIEAYLGTLALPPEQRFDARLRAWFDACEPYRQLHEMPRGEYVELKHALAESR